MNKNKLIPLILFLFLFTGFLVSTVPVKGQEFDFRTDYEIKINNNGSARWIIENQVTLSNQEEINEFNEFMNNFSYEKNKKIFINDTKSIVKEAEEQTNREMKVTGFQIEIDKFKSITDTFGVVKYKFTWINFSKTLENKLIVGDVFVGGLTLERNSSFGVTLPQNYSLSSVNPEGDEKQKNKLIWNGPRNFEEGEPLIKLIHERNGDQGPSPDDNNLEMMFVFLVSLSIVSVIGFWYFYNKKRSKRKDDMEKSDLKRDEVKILDLIKEKDGEMFQSEIVEKTDFSKSKISNLLSDLKEKNKIKKIQSGRRNLIRLK